MDTEKIIYLYEMGSWGRERQGIETLEFALKLLRIAPVPPKPARPLGLQNYVQFTMWMGWQRK